MSKRFLSKAILESRYNISYVSEDGKVILDKKGKQLNQNDMKAIHTNGKTKSYLSVSTIDNDSKKSTNILVHNLVYAWYNEDYDVDLVIDHIDNNSYNNNLSNLQQVSQKDNLAKDCDWSEQQKRTNEIKKEKIKSGDYLEITREQYNKVKRTNRNWDCFGYTQHYHYISKEDWAHYLKSLDDYELAILEEQDRILGE